MIKLIKFIKLIIYLPNRESIPSAINAKAEL